MQPSVERAEQHVTGSEPAAVKSGPARVPGPAASEHTMSVVVVRNRSELRQYVDQWQELAEDALEPNIFYEPWFVIPALKALDTDKTLECVLVFGPSQTDSSAKILCGFFPLERHSRYKGIPCSVLKLWRH